MPWTVRDICVSRGRLTQDHALDYPTAPRKFFEDDLVATRLIHSCHLVSVPTDSGDSGPALLLGCAYEPRKSSEGLELYCGNRQRYRCHADWGP